MAASKAKRPVATTKATRHSRDLAIELEKAEAAIEKASASSAELAGKGTPETRTVR